VSASVPATGVIVPQSEAGTALPLSRLAWQRFRRHRIALITGGILLIIVLVSAAAPLLAPEEAANQVNPLLSLSPPSLAHPFGTDDVGRDMFWRTIYGGRISLAIGLLSVLIAMTVGIMIGCLAGFYGGVVDSLLMRFTDAVLSIPSLFMLIVLTQILGPTVPAIILVIGLLNWMQVSRIVRANFLSLKGQDFVLAARASGVDDRAIMMRHILPNTLAPVIVAATLGIGHAIILEASASFLGLGVQPPTASWGSTLNRAQEVMVMAPWVAIFPGLMILLTVLCVNFIGDGLRDALDPHTRRT
jgi:peptide/nickel transport system permease protein